MEKLVLKYFSLLEHIDQTFVSLQSQYSQEVQCRPGCVDCCHAYFEVSPIEVLMLAMGYARSVATNADLAAQLKQQASEAAKEVDELKQQAMNSPALKDISLWRVRCPLLVNNQSCALYEVRPVTCRVYGLPTSIAGKGHVCGLSNFQKGVHYPTVKLDAVFAALEEMSEEAKATLKEKGDLTLARIPLFNVLLDIERYISLLPESFLGSNENHLT